MSIRPLALLAALLLPATASAEISPGTTDNGYTVYEILNYSSGSAGGSLGVLVVVGTSDIVVGSNTWAKKTAYWYFSTPNAQGQVCAPGATGPVFPAQNLGLKMKHHGTGSGTASWAISTSGAVKGCTPTSAGVQVMGQTPLDTPRTNYPQTENGITARWTVSAPAQAGGVAQTGDVYLHPVDQGQKLRWAYGQASGTPTSCPAPNPTPVFKVSLDQVVLLTYVTTFATKIPCAVVSQDPLLPQQ